VNEMGEPIVKEGKLSMGNLESQRDWGFAGDYVEAMWLMLQQPEPDDAVIGTGRTWTIQQLCEKAFAYVGADWQAHVVVDSRFTRPTETGPMVADASKAQRTLGWRPRTSFDQLIAMMVDAHLTRLAR
jgi:GDPmannose 4,6-dehydratase